MAEPAAVLSDSSVPRLPRHVKLRFDRTRDAWVLLGPERVLMPDEIALEILRRCDGAATIGAIVDDLARGYDVERAVVARDVRALLQDLVDRGFLQA